MKCFLSIGFLLFFLAAYAQVDELEDPDAPANTTKTDTVAKPSALPNPYKIALKLVPLALIDPSMSTVQFGAEWQFQDYKSLNLDLGFRPQTQSIETTARKRSRGIKARFQYRNYAQNKSLRGFYSGIEAFYKYQAYEYEVVFGHECADGNGVVSCAYYEFKDTRINNHASSLGFLFGFQPLARSTDRTEGRFIFDINTSIGMRWVRENYPEVTDEVVVFDTVSRLAEYRTFKSPTDFVYPNIGLTLRIGWWIS